MIEINKGITVIDGHPLDTDAELISGVVAYISHLQDNISTEYALATIQDVAVVLTGYTEAIEKGFENKKCREYAVNKLLNSRKE